MRTERSTSWLKIIMTKKLGLEFWVSLFCCLTRSYFRQGHGKELGNDR